MMCMYKNSILSSVGIFYDDSVIKCLIAHCLRVNVDSNFVSRIHGVVISSNAYVTVSIKNSGL